MRKEFVILMFMSIAMTLCCPAFSQSTDRNYVRTVTYLDSIGSDYFITVQYYDGLGRPNQTATGGCNTSGTYLHGFTEYDACGRESRIWSPVAGGQTPDFLTPSEIQTSSTGTYGDSRGYSDIKSTQVYADVVMDTKIDAVNRMSSFFSQG